LPVGIEQDLSWYTDPQTGETRAIVSHGKPFDGEEPVLKQHFFERVRPIVERELAEGDPGKWPVLIVHFDFKSSEREHLQEIWSVLDEYSHWLTTAKKTADITDMQPLNLKPVMALTESSDEHKRVFYDELPVGATMLIFGAASRKGVRSEGRTRQEVSRLMAAMTPEEIVSQPANNYRRWWNNSWYLVEEGGAPRAGDWTEKDEARLRSLVEHAHRLGYLIRFYTLNGVRREENQGWSNGYNFGSLEAVRERWEAATRLGVDLIATDQYESLAETIAGQGKR
jgi:hypothetical protein